MKRRLLACMAGLFAGSLLLTLSSRVLGQVEVKASGGDSVKHVKILNADNEHFVQKDDSTGLTSLVGNVRIQQGKTLIYCDSLIMNGRENTIECFGHVHINDNDTTDIYSDYMKYLENQRMVHFEKNVKLSDGKGILTTQDLDYDMGQRVGTYNHGGKVVNKESVLTSDRGVYFEDTKDVHFKDNVILRDPQYDLSSDSLLYNTKSQVSTFITETFIQFKDSTKRTVRTKSGFYDLANRKAEFGKRPIITDGSQQITGDSVVMDDSTGISTATGNADYKDTTQGIRLLAGHMTNNKKKNTFLATQRPLLILKQDKDSIYVTADTLMSARLVDFEAQQKILAHEDSLHHIYVDSLERRSADSLHRVALERQRKDSLSALHPDTTDMESRDRSDSLSAGAADSLSRIGLDSLHRMGVDTLPGAQTDTALKKTALVKKDSSAAQKIAAQLADTTKGHLTEKLRKQLEKQLVKARADSVNDIKVVARLKIEAAKDSVLKKIQARKDSISDLKDSARAKIRAARDSVKAAAAAVKAKHYAAIDSVRKAGFAAKARIRFIADSIKQQGVADSLIAHTLAIGDSVRNRKLSDSLKKGGWTDSALVRRGLPKPVDSFALRRLADSVKQVVLAKAYADSIAHLPPTDSTLRYIIGFHHVRIFSDSLQAISDSLYYSTKDSIFRLFYNPVAWGSGHYQITGDTMYVYTKNKKADRLYVFENALTINRVAKNFYNQLKGTTINCYFHGGDIDFIRAKGNAESVYYMQDDAKAYTGVNHSHADIIDMVFAPKVDSAGKPALDSTGKSKGKELNRVVLRSDADGSVIPMRKVNFDDMVLRGFKWLEEKRPKSKEELFEAIKHEREDDDIEAAERAAIKQSGSQPAALPTVPIIDKPLPPPPSKRKKP